MLEGLMQNDYPLTVKHVLDRVRRFGADSEVVTLTGEEEVRRAYRAAADRFVTVLGELCGELSLLRTQVRLGGAEPDGVIARRMFTAAAYAAAGRFDDAKNTAAKALAKAGPDLKSQIGNRLTLYGMGQPFVVPH